MLRVCTVNYHNRIVYAEHVLLHHLILFLLNLIQCPYHGIVVAFVTKHLFHVQQQALHGDIFAFIQGAGPFTWILTETCKDMGVHTGLVILLEEGIHIKMCVCHFCTWISQLKEGSACPILLEPTTSSPYSLCGPCDGANGLWSHLQWSNHQSPTLPCLVRKEVNLPADNGNLRLRWSSTMACHPHTSSGPGICCLLYHGQSSSLLGCTPH